METKDVWMPPLYYSSHEIGLSIECMNRELYALTFMPQDREVVVWMEANDFFLYDDDILNDRKNDVDAIFLAIVHARVDNM